MLAEFPLLSFVIWTPIIGGVMVLFLGDENVAKARQFALFTSILTFLISVPLYGGFATDTAAMQFEELAPWIPFLR